MNYHYRVFYYIFFLELIKFELKMIKSELNQRTKNHSSIRNSWCHSAVNSVNENNIKRINAYCQLVNELSGCMNSTFGLSNFATILYCFHMPLTDANWALWELDQRPWNYIFVFSLWLVYLSLLILLLFKGATDCKIAVEQIVFYLNEINIDFEDESALVQIEAVMLHLTKNPIVFHCRGLFTISNRTFLKMIGGISGYI
ncbi:uncharacterized protein LOC116340633 [Contarinia nasturtii]|uniref:uncharacterized protein LOC116340633 n=1 Tax=Contarinia nasturtii TaxID=265458 RepID=UPI0012D44C69|nr:uncharacterized protein LOC116340633 [Contarinia nasturtii]